jgi:hypothetical protein
MEFILLASMSLRLLKAKISRQVILFETKEIIGSKIVYLILRGDMKEVESTIVFSNLNHIYRRMLIRSQLI